MTCIVGVADGETVTIGGDSAGVSGMSLIVRADGKVWSAPPFVYGFTTSFRMGQLLRWSFQPPEQPDAEPTEKYLATRFVDALRACLEAGGWLETDKGRADGGTFLLGYKGGLYRIEGDFQVGQSVAGFDAVGCGADLALGALHATDGQPTTDRVRIALEAAERFSAGVRGPFTIVNG